MSGADQALAKELASLTKRQNIFEDKILAGSLTPELFDYCVAASERYAAEAQKVRTALLETGGGLEDEAST